MTEARPVLYLVDDDASVLKAMNRLFRAAGYVAETFASAEAFLKSPFQLKNAVLIVDIHMPGLSGLDLQLELTRDGIDIPVIFITAHDNAETREKARRAGAAAYFRKPVDARALLDAIEWALSAPSAFRPKKEEQP